jgi:hypothetical protein
LLAVIGVIITIMTMIISYVAQQNAKVDDMKNSSMRPISVNCAMVVADRWFGLLIIIGIAC